MPLDIVFRTAGTSLLLLTAALLLLSAPRTAVARWFLPLALGIGGFLGVNTAFAAAELPGPLWSLASFFSRMSAVFLWLFCLVLFDGRVRSPALALSVSGTWLALVVIDKGYLAPAAEHIDTSPILVVMGTGLLLHAGWRVMRDLRDDLVERRRGARPVFALGLLGLLAIELAAEVLLGIGRRPAAFLMLQNASIVALCAGLALWLLRAQPWLTVHVPLLYPSPDRPAGELPHDPEAAVIARVESVMQARRPHLDPDLTFAQFAAMVGVPEPALRRAINHRLGHGHFRTFLNGCRVDEAKRMLRDPARAGDKIVAVALDSGFSSLASFNRAFRQIAACSPSEYRSGAHVAAIERKPAEGF